MFEIMTPLAQAKKKIQGNFSNSGADVSVQIIMECLTSFPSNGKKMSVEGKAKLPLSNLHRFPCLEWSSIGFDF